MIENIKRSMIDYFGKDVRRINHALKVYGFATAIAGGENLESETNIILEMAALLHDIGIPESERKYHSSSGRYQEIEGPPIAREILSKWKINTSIIDRVCFLIGHHHTYTAIDGIDFQILVEADFLVNIDEDHMTPQMIESAGSKYFATATGLKILQSMFQYDRR